MAKDAEKAAKEALAVFQSVGDKKAETKPRAQLPVDHAWYLYVILYYVKLHYIQL